MFLRSLYLTVIALSVVALTFQDHYYDLDRRNLDFQPDPAIYHRGLAEQDDDLELLRRYMKRQKLAKRARITYVYRCLRCPHMHRISVLSTNPQPATPNHCGVTMIFLRTE
jgi:hypothetical protein